MQNPKRKNIRLKDYDYSSNGAYFITVCAKDRQNIFGRYVGSDDPVRPALIEVSPIGSIISQSWNMINEIYSGVTAGKYVIMPNHFHGIIIIGYDEDSGITAVGGQRRPPLQKIVQGFKSVTTRRCFPLGHSVIWQRSFYDHIIRSEQEYLKVWEYINSNPYKWSEDEYCNIDIK